MAKVMSKDEFRDNYILETDGWSNYADFLDDDERFANILKLIPEKKRQKILAFEERDRMQEEINDYFGSDVETISEYYKAFCDGTWIIDYDEQTDEIVAEKIWNTPKAMKFKKTRKQ